MKFPPALRAVAVPLRERLSLLLPFLASIALALGSTHRLVRVVRSTGARAGAVDQLTREIEVLEQRRVAAGTESIASRHAEARQKLIAGETGAREWLRDMTVAAARHDFEVQTRVGTGDRRLTGPPVVDVVSVTLILKPRTDPGEKRAPSIRLSELLLELGARPEWVEITHLSVQGRGTGFSVATLTVHLWVIPPDS